MEKDLAYFARRANEERTAADASADGRVRKAHLEMARRYDAAVAEISGEMAMEPAPEPVVSAE